MAKKKLSNRTGKNILATVYELHDDYASDYHDEPYDIYQLADGQSLDTDTGCVHRLRGVFVSFNEDEEPAGYACSSQAGDEADILLNTNNTLSFTLNGGNIDINGSNT